MGSTSRVKFNTTTSTLSGQLTGVQKPSNVRNSFVLPAPHRAQRVRIVVTQSNRDAPSASHQRALLPR